MAPAQDSLCLGTSKQGLHSATSSTSSNAPPAALLLFSAAGHSVKNQELQFCLLAKQVKNSEKISFSLTGL